jgi:hypothetical protein
VTVPVPVTEARFTLTQGKKPKTVTPLLVVDVAGRLCPAAICAAGQIVQLPGDIPGAVPPSGAESNSMLNAEKPVLENSIVQLVHDLVGTPLGVMLLNAKLLPTAVKEKPN